MRVKVGGDVRCGGGDGVDVNNVVRDGIGKNSVRVV